MQKYEIFLMEQTESCQVTFFIQDINIKPNK